MSIMIISSMYVFIINPIQMAVNLEKKNQFSCYGSFQKQKSVAQEK